jgi:hypothetical protein
LLLLRAALSEGSTAGEAWLEFLVTSAGIDHLEGDAFRVLPQLFRHLQALGLEDPALGRLRGIYRHAWFRNQLLLQAGSDAIGLLRAAAVDTMILGGAALVARRIRDVGSRLMDRIDILVHPRDVERALEVLALHGWVSNEPYSPHQVMHRRTVELVDGSQGRLGIHRSALFLGDDDNKIWAAADTVLLGGVTTLAPSPVDQLLVDCAQGLGWLPASRCWIPDVALLVRATTGLIDWRDLADRACQFGIPLDVADALEFLGTEFALEFPSDVLVWLRQSAGPSERLFHCIKMRARRRPLFLRLVRRAARGCDAIRRLASAPTGTRKGRECLFILVEEWGALQWGAAAARRARQAARRLRRVSSS